MSPTLLDPPRSRDDLDGVDPRLLARREEVSEQRRRRRRRRLGAVLVLATLLALAVWAARSPLLDVSDVRVVGAEHTSVESLLAATGVQVGDPLVQVDLGDVEAGVETLPWIDDAHARRDWSDGTVTIEVTERDPVAVLDAGAAGWLLVDAEGRVLDAVDVVPTDLPVLAGVPGVDAGEYLDSGAASGGLQVAQLLSPGVRSRVVSIDVTDPEAIELELAPSGSVLLGGAEELETKLASLRVVLSQVDLAGLATIDLRIPDTPVLTREQS